MKCMLCEADISKEASLHHYPDVKRLPAWARGMRICQTCWDKATICVVCGKQNEHVGAVCSEACLMAFTDARNKLNGWTGKVRFHIYDPLEGLARLLYMRFGNRIGKQQRELIEQAIAMAQELNDEICPVVYEGDPW